MKSKINTVKKQENNKIIGTKVLVERVIGKKVGMQSRIDVNKVDTEKIIRRFLREINKSLIDGETVRLMGSFTLKTVIRASKVAFNFKTKKKQVIPAIRTPKISFSQDLKEQIRNKK